MDPAVWLGCGPLLLLGSTKGLAVFNCVTGNGNATTEQEAKKVSCSYPNENCTDGTTEWRKGGHFSMCPEEYKYYCFKGRCRYIAVEEKPSCLCENGYTGARCDRLDLFYQRSEQGEIMVVSLIAIMVILIILVVCICICTHYFKKKCRKRKEEEMGTFEKGLPVKTEDILETDLV
nr:PREDICTED: probetacellulin isoform X1 [Anolis carolinensis]|eukprot:XP_008111290.1 PREDICTED: probetacellulin isoform X1 [Anolis carolinensis]